MAKKGFRSLTIKQEAYDLLEGIAEENNCSLSKAVALVVTEFLTPQKKPVPISSKEALPNG